MEIIQLVLIAAVYQTEMALYVMVIAVLVTTIQLA
jgi:hypothetical protein